MIQRSDIVSRKGESAHCKVTEMNSANGMAWIRWYDSSGEQVAWVNEKDLEFIAHNDTKQYLEMLTLFGKGTSAFHADRNRMRRKIGLVPVDLEKFRNKILGG